MFEHFRNRVLLACPIKFLLLFTKRIFFTAVIFVKHLKQKLRSVREWVKLLKIKRLSKSKIHEESRTGSLSKSGIHRPDISNERW